uniref:Uncharacterized protein n=1 Tax=Tanacetum cinerariifolium TaxID=118510 RepID=A0A6L2NWZ9_TANCI|nr:hypothetical protein CTI12_AA182560 [Tanacetum cinerariifolium]
MDDPDITMKEYIRLEAEKALGRAIVYNDALTSKVELSCEPTIFNVDDLKLDMGNDDDKIDIKKSSWDLSIETLPNVISTDVSAYAQGSNKLLETSPDTSNLGINALALSDRRPTYQITDRVHCPTSMTFDETPPPSKTSTLVDDDLNEEEAIKFNKRKNLENDIKDETIEVEEIINIKESKNHPLENVIGNLNQITLRSQA